MNARVLQVESIIEEAPTSAFQSGLLVLCGLCLVIDGFDVQAMGYVAPAIVEDWHVSKAALGPVFGVRVAEGRDEGAGLRFG